MFFKSVCTMAALVSTYPHVPVVFSAIKARKSFFSTFNSVGPVVQQEGAGLL